jgi:hypothetical protein
MHGQQNIKFGETSLIKKKKKESKGWALYLLEVKEFSFERLASRNML